MIRKRNEKTVYIRKEDGSVILGTMADFYCKSGEFPSGNIVTGSFLMHVDTGDIYAYDEESSAWIGVESFGSGDEDILK